MKVLLKLEEVLMLALASYLTTFLSYPTWLYWTLFLAPDISMVGYAANSTVGAWCYNLFHHKGIALALYLIGIYLAIEPLQFIGLLLFGHSSFDRALGYGLKLADNFKLTHLGVIGKNDKT